MDTYKRALMKKVEDRAKEQEELIKIEKEQRQVEPIANLTLGKKGFCIKALGLEMYDKVYRYLLKAKKSRIDHATMQKELLMLVNNNKDKMNVVFTIDQMIESELAKISSI